MYITTRQSANICLTSGTTPSGRINTVGEEKKKRREKNHKNSGLPKLLCWSHPFLSDKFDFYGLQFYFYGPQLEIDKFGDFILQRTAESFTHPVTRIVMVIGGN